MYIVGEQLSRRRHTQASKKSLRTCYKKPPDDNVNGPDLFHRCGERHTSWQTTELSHKSHTSAVESHDSKSSSSNAANPKPDNVIQASSAVAWVYGETIRSRTEGRNKEIQARHERDNCSERYAKQRDRKRDERDLCSKGYEKHEGECEETTKNFAFTDRAESNVLVTHPRRKYAM